MIKHLFISSLLITSLVQAQQTKIFNGETVAGGWYPWQAMISIQQSDGGHLCGGSLIAPHWVLTAAHCVAKKGRILKADKVKVGLGETKRSKMKNKMIPVSQVIVHEGYDSYKKVGPNDVALLKLSRSVKIQPVKLATSKRWAKQPNNMLKVMGWGLTETGKTSDDLQIVDLAVVSDSYCKKIYKSAYKQGQLCVGDLSGAKDSCGGDSGGPLFRGINEKSTQYGVVSYGAKQCASKNQPAVYASVPDYINWIKQKIGADANQLKLNQERSSTVKIAQNISKGNRALLVGVGKYYLGNNLNLSGPNLDVDSMKQLLIKKFKYKPEQVMVLKDEMATADNIRLAARDWLIGQSRAGDKVWLYFSGHGAFLPDVNGDETTADSHIGVPADETILPYDTDMLTTQSISNDSLSGIVTYTMNHLLDDEINQWTQKLRNRQLTVMFDSCHSGTATRSFSLSDKSKSGTLAMNYWLSDDLGSGKKSAPNILRKGTIVPLKNHQEKIGKNMVFWGAASSSETAKDSSKGGYFTRAFVEGVNGKADSNADGDVSYAELHNYVRHGVQNQTPQLEIDSTRLSESIFSRDIVSAPVETAAEVLSNNNPHGLKIEWLDAKMNPTSDLRVCRAQDCPDYKLRISAKQDGWLLLYDLEDNGNLQQYVPNKRHQLIKNGVFVKAGEPFVFPIDFKMTSDVPSNLVAILLDPVERVNYDKIKYQLDRQQHAKQGFFYSVINRRDNIIDKDGKPAQLSVKIKYYSPK